jgi:hypothetical protein
MLKEQSPWVATSPVSVNPPGLHLMSDANPNDTLTSSELEHLKRLEATVQRIPGVDVDVVNALADIGDGRLYRGTHRTFEAYLLERWGIRRLGGDQRTPAVEPEGYESLTDAWEQARRELSRDDVTAVDIRLTVHKGRNPDEFYTPYSPIAAELSAGTQFERLRWLLTQSSGMVAAVANQLEDRPADLNDDARVKLQDDVDVLDDELALLKVLLLGPVDWDAEQGRLLAGEIPPFDDDSDDEDEVD